MSAHMALTVGPGAVTNRGGLLIQVEEHSTVSVSYASPRSSRIRGISHHRNLHSIVGYLLLEQTRGRKFVSLIGGTCRV
jgi:hypothetical protein